MARSGLKIVVDQKTPLNLENKSGRQLLRKVIRHLEGILGGSVDASHIRVTVDGAQPVAASSIVTMASVAVADTVTLNGTTITATEKRANCTVTVGTSVDADDTVTVNGVAFTAKVSPSGELQWAITGVAATDAAALVAKINACTDPLISGLIGAVRRAADGVVSIYALATGTAGNSYTIATSDAVDLAITDDNSGAFAGGASTVNDVFDPIGSDIVVAKELARCINASTSAKIAKHVEASNWAGSVALSSCPAGTIIRVGPHSLRAIAAANTTPQANPGDFSISGSNSADGDTLVTAINTHPVLSHDVVASNSSGTVTIRQRRGTSAYGRIQCEPLGSQTVTQFAETAVVRISALDPDQTGNAIPLASSNGTRLAVGAAQLAGGTGPASGTAVTIICGGSAQ